MNLRKALELIEQHLKQPGSVDPGDLYDALKYTLKLLEWVLTSVELLEEIKRV